MPRSRRSPLTMTLCSALIAAVSTAALGAQKLVAEYELLSDLRDSTAKHANAALQGNPTPPKAPKNGVCLNGVYRFASGGQDIQFPNMSTLDATDFQIDVEFKINQLPSFQAPVLMGGRGWRWIGIYVSSNGTVGIKFNNSNHVWSKTRLVTGKWYSAVLMYEKSKARLLIDGLAVYNGTLATLNTGGNKDFVTNDYSVGRAHNGCIRRLRIWNDANFSGGQFVVAGSRCNKLRMVGTIPWPRALKPYRFQMTGGAARLPAILFLGVRHNRAIDLTAAGAPGCTWFVNPVIVTTATTDGQGNATWGFVPPRILGARVWFQWLNLNPRGNKLGLTFSDYATMVIGS